MSSRVVFALSLVIVVFAACRSHAEGQAATTHPLFSIRKSENRNRVEYAIRLDAECRPSGRAPVVAYWRMFERGPGERESLAAFERMAYGISSQRTDPEGPGTRVAIVLRALRERTIGVVVSSSNGRCSARATAIVDRVACDLEDVYVVQSGPLSVDHVELRGRSLADGTTRRESLAR